MTLASWICLAAPLAGAVAITLLGTSISRRVAGYISSASVFAAFVAAVIAFSRLHGESSGQIFALAVMAVAASEVVVGLGLIVAIAQKRLDLDVDKLSFLRG